MHYAMGDAYLQGDIKTFASFLHEKFYVIGTSKTEIFRSKKTAVKFYTDTGATQ
ncbi:MAG: hypothetical protein QM791_16935 [Ferruginibacter sp.]